VKVATWQGESRFTIDKVAEPVAGPGQVVVAVHAAGICGTDVHATQGLFPWKPPLVLGHEYTGVVREVGRGVSKSLVGRHVGCEPSYGCGECAECAAGRVSQCPKCVRIGGFAERVALPARNVHLLPRGLDPVTAAMTEPAACCLAGLEAFQMPRGATVLVIGGGIMGLVTMALAKRRGARRLILSDPIAERRDMARRLGASVVIDPTRESLKDKVLELTGGRGADVVYDSVGRTTFAGSLASLRPRGLCVLFGQSSGAVPPFDLNQLNTLGSLFVTRPSLAHYSAARHELEERAGAVLGAIQRSELRIRIGGEWPLAQAADAQRALESRGTTGKLLLVA
jgi:NADPH2:quinone reductase